MGYRFVGLGSLVLTLWCGVLLTTAGLQGTGLVLACLGVLAAALLAMVLRPGRLTSSLAAAVAAGCAVAAGVAPSPGDAHTALLTDVSAAFTVGSCLVVAIGCAMCAMFIHEDAGRLSP